jgi:YHS domain-containing protein
MIQLRRLTLAVCVVAGLGMALTLACKKDAPPVAAAPTMSPAEVEAKLAKADAYDGTTDKILSKCLTCGLGMAGKSDFSYMHHGYTLHFCSVECRTVFAKDSAKAVANLEVPSS